jgi:hypothetical protein
VTTPVLMLMESTCDDDNAYLGKVKTTSWPCDRYQGHATTGTKAPPRQVPKTTMDPITRACNADGPRSAAMATCMGPDQPPRDRAKTMPRAMMAKTVVEATRVVATGI